MKEGKVILSCVAIIYDKSLSAQRKPEAFSRNHENEKEEMEEQVHWS